MRRTFAIDVLECPACKGRMKLVAMVTEPRNIARFLSAGDAVGRPRAAAPAATRAAQPAARAAQPPRARG
ncbi:hypothetical protein [Sorangium sp. So ce426]|uniref:hypothetical protein n=2 Tax=unclassified Sorangium TaxID=2621164 RepID=UPI003F5BC3B6